MENYAELPEIPYEKIGKAAVILWLLKIFIF